MSIGSNISAPDISVIVVTYFTGPSLWKCLRSCADAKEVIIVNNGNHPHVVERLISYAEKHDHIHLLDGNGNIGFAAACNLGAKQAQSEILMFLNPDAVLHEPALEEMFNALTSLPKPSVVGGRLLDIYGKEQRGARRGNLTPWSALVSMTGLAKFSQKSSIFTNMHWENRPLPKQPQEVPALSGACMMFRKPDFEQIGGFDEKYFLHVEDLDICRNIYNAGGKVVFVPTAEITHYGSTSKVHILRVNWYKTKGLVRYFLKFSKTPWSKAGAALLAPAIFLAIMVRASWLSLKS